MIDYDSIIQLVQESGDMAKTHAGNVSGRLTAKQWTTELDIEIENRLKEKIETFGKNHIVYAEEDNYVFTHSEDIWAIDPISHTFSFIHGLPHYAVVVSHLHKGQVLFACVYDPSMQEIYIAFKDKGAYMNDTKLQVSAATNDLCILYETVPVEKWTKEHNAKMFTTLMNVGWVKMYGSAGLHYAYVASGRVDACVCTNKDTFPEFAGKLLVEEAGGTFTDFKGQALTHTTRGIIASNGIIHQRLLQAVNQI
jgi:myo-inositol-1(or 4)-monophosphatase